MKITKRMNKLAIERDQSVNPWSGELCSRAVGNNWITARRREGGYTPVSLARIRNDRIWEAAQDKALREADKRWRRECRPVYLGDGGMYWVARKTPDRSILRQRRKNQSTSELAR